MHIWLHIQSYENPESDAGTYYVWNRD